MQAAREWLAKARSVAVLTGAGISAESGIPTFRGGGGLWKQFRAEDLATPQAFARDPVAVWEWYDWRRCLIARAQPNRAHLALAELENRTPRFSLITQNVDGLHDRAGSRRILKVHGDIWRLRCAACGKEWDDYTCPLPHLPPPCSCGGMARPGVIWFGEALPADVWTAAGQAAASCEVFLVIGTSALVYPAAGLVTVAEGAGARVIEINLERTPYSGQVDCSLQGKAGELLPELIKS